MQVHTHTY